MGYAGSVEELCKELCLNEKNRKKGETYEECVVKCVNVLIGNT